MQVQITVQSTFWNLRHDQYELQLNIQLNLPNQEQSVQQ